MPKDNTSTPDIRILLIEDNPGDRDLIFEMLAAESGGISSITAASSLSQALEALEGEAFDVILMDLWLPDHAGSDSFKQIMSRAPDIPIILLSGNEDEATAIRTVQEGAQDYLVKGTFDSLVLVRSLRYAIERAHILIRNRELQKQLLRSQKMDVIGKLAGGIAHDFNNLLTVILGNAQLGTVKFPPDHPGHVIFSDIKSAAEQAKKLTMKLLSFSHRNKIQVRPLPVSLMLHEFAELLRRTLPKNIEILSAPLEHDAVVRVDKAQMLQAFLNICNNSAEAMPSGGRIELTAELLNSPPHDLDIPCGESAVCRISIADTGHGLPEQIRDTAFQPFVSTKDQTLNIGLGLTVSHDIVGNHSGRITISSPGGHGTVVDVFLPVSDTQHQPVSPGSTGAVCSRESVLVVDDEALVLRTTSNILHAAGYNVVTAGSGEDALKIVDQGPQEIGLVILDMMMPGMDGSDVFFALKERRPDLPVLLASGYSREGEVAFLIDNGAVGYVQKPFTISELNQALRNIKNF